MDSGQTRWTILWFKVVLHVQFLIFTSCINKIGILIFLVTVLWQSLKGQVLKNNALDLSCHVFLITCCSCKSDDEQSGDTHTQIATTVLV